jgi:hypothetical protein
MESHLDAVIGLQIHIVKYLAEPMVIDVLLFARKDGESVLHGVVDVDHRFGAKDS